MVSVILLLLKIFGLILLGILCLVLLVILTVLLVPIRFEARGSLYEKKPEGRVSVSWLLHILSVSAVYDGSLDTSVRVFGFRLGAHEGNRDGTAKKEKRKKKRRSKRGAGEAEEKESPETKKDAAEKAELAGQMISAEKKEPAETSEKTAAAEHAETEKKMAADHEDSALKGGRRGFTGIFRRICGRIKSGIRRIRKRLQAIWQKLLDLKEKKERLQAFLENEENRATIKLAKRQAFRLVKHILPRKLEGRVRFGFEDPYTTGQVLTYISPFYGWYAGKVEVIPVFEEAALEGNLRLKGRIRIGTVLVIAGRMLLDKNFRKLLKRFRAA